MILSPLKPSGCKIKTAVFLYLVIKQSAVFVTQLYVSAYSQGIIWTSGVHNSNKLLQEVGIFTASYIFWSNKFDILCCSQIFTASYIFWSNSVDILCCSQIARALTLIDPDRISWHCH
jgi:hypothetical protein